VANAKFDIRTEATRPLYASVGVTDRAVEAVRGSLATGQKRIAEVQQDARQIELRPKALRTQAASLFSDGVDTVTKEAKARRAAVEARITEMQQAAQAVLEERELTYSQLVNRGETLVQRVRRQSSTQEAKRNAKTTSAKAKSTGTQAQKGAKTTSSSAKSAAKSATSTAKKQSTRPKSSAKGTSTAAKKTASATARATKDAAAKVGD
jgi:heparin binding hemagglutinin HbhA